MFLAVLSTNQRPPVPGAGEATATVHVIVHPEPQSQHGVHQYGAASHPQHGQQQMDNPYAQAATHSGPHQDVLQSIIDPHGAASRPLPEHNAHPQPPVSNAQSQPADPHRPVVSDPHGVQPHSPARRQGACCSNLQRFQERLANERHKLERKNQEEHALPQDVNPLLNIAIGLRAYVGTHSPGKVPELDNVVSHFQSAWESAKEKQVSVAELLVLNQQLLELAATLKK